MTTKRTWRRRAKRAESLRYELVALVDELNDIARRERVTLTAERDRARAIAVELEQEVAHLTEVIRVEEWRWRCRFPVGLHPDADVAR